MTDNVLYLDRTMWRGNMFKLADWLNKNCRNEWKWDLLEMHPRNSIMLLFEKDTACLMFLLQWGHLVIAPPNDCAQ